MRKLTSILLILLAIGFSRLAFAGARERAAKLLQTAIEAEYELKSGRIIKTPDRDEKDATEACGGDFVEFKVEMSPDNFALRIGERYTLSDLFDREKVNSETDNCTTEVKTTYVFLERKLVQETKIDCREDRPDESSGFMRSSLTWSLTKIAKKDGRVTFEKPTLTFHQETSLGKIDPIEKEFECVYTPNKLLRVGTGE